MLYHCSLKFVLRTLIHNLELFTQQFIQLMSYEYESRDSWAVWIWIWKVMNSHEYESYEPWILVNMNQKKPWTHEYESVIVILVNSYESYSSWIIFIWPWTIWILNRVLYLLGNLFLGLNFELVIGLFWPVNFFIPRRVSNEVGSQGVPIWDLSVLYLLGNLFFRFEFCDGNRSFLNRHF